MAVIGMTAFGAGTIHLFMSFALCVGLFMRESDLSIFTTTAAEWGYDGLLLAHYVPPVTYIPMAAFWFGIFIIAGKSSQRDDRR